MMKKGLFLVAVLGLIATTACDNDDNGDVVINDPATAAKVEVDRFSDDAGTLMKRSANSDLPDPDEPINFDEAPFITQSLGPNGEVVRYYNFDVMPLAPAPIYVLFKEGADEPVSGQLNIIDVIPGDLTYSDFWQMYKVTVPNDYVANEVASYQEIVDRGYATEKLDAVVNCPVVPYGSTATENVDGDGNALDSGWYKGKVVYYFTFMEKEITVNAQGQVPTSPIYVTFNINPAETGGGPPSGFVTEAGTVQTHNVVATIPTDASYSPLWDVYVYDNADFSEVNDLSSAVSANILARNVMYVNCPVVFVGQ